jgi:hypothetical protein
MPIDTSILGGITLPQLRDPQQEAIQRFNLQTAQLQQQRLQQEMQTEREKAAQTAQLNKAMVQASGFVSQYIDPKTGLIPPEKFGEIVQKSGIPGQYTSNVINMLKTMNADVIAQRKNESEWQKTQNERENRMLATLADQTLGIDDFEARKLAFFANLGRLVSKGTVDENTSQQILSNISNPDGSINSDRMTAVLESVVRMDKDVAASRQAAQKQPVVQGEYVTIPSPSGPVRKWFSKETLEGVGVPVYERPRAPKPDERAVDSSTVKGWIKQLADGVAKIENMPENVRNTVVTELDKQGVSIAQLTAANKNRAETAKTLMSSIDDVASLAKQMNKLNLFGIMGGRLREIAESGSLLNIPLPNNLSEEQKQVLGEFATKAGLLQSGVAMVHGGARAAGSIGLQNALKPYLSPDSKDYNVYIGNLNGMRSVLKKYAEMKAIGRDEEPPASGVGLPPPPDMSGKWKYDFAKKQWVPK